MNSDKFETLNVERNSQFTGLPSGTRQLGPYLLLSELGRGAMGTVYEAEHTNLKRLVALKVLPEEMAASPERYARFQREMEAIGKLEHPNIVLATDAGQLDGVCFIAMQLINGVDLSAVLRDHDKLSPPLACEVVRQVALGLNEINRHGMIHRDIKPSNILLASNGEVKILDLGIASLRQKQFADDSLTRTGSLLGTPDYVAPEQIVNLGPIDIRADIYSLGCTFYQLLSGVTPFSGPQYDSFPAKLFGHAQHEPPQLDAQSLQIPASVLDTLNRMLAKVPDQRFATPLEIADALEPHCDANGLDTLAASYGEPGRARGKPLRAASDNAEQWRTQPGSHISVYWKAAGAVGGLCALLLAFGLMWSSVKPIDDRSKTHEQSLALLRQQQQATAVEQTAVLAQLAEDTGVIADETQGLSTSVTVIADSSRAVENNTERIALTLEQMQMQFSEVVSKLHKDPQSPTEWYANALLHAKSGNNVEARAAYLKFFTFDFNVVDPYQSFATLLKLQEGTATAREVFEQIPGDHKLAARRMVSIGLLPEEQQRPLLQQLIDDEPAFGPAHYAFALTYKDSYDSRSLLDQAAKKKALTDYLKANETGQVLKYYLDQAQVAPTLERVQHQLLTVHWFSEEMLENPVGMTMSLSSPRGSSVDQWRLHFSFAEEARDPEYRLGTTGEFQQLGGRDYEGYDQLPAAYKTMIPSFIDRSLTRSAELWLPEDSPNSKLQIQYLDRNSVHRGPFEFDLDPEGMRLAPYLAHCKKPDDQEDGPRTWVTITKKHKSWSDLITYYDAISFSNLLNLGWRAVKSMRYGINVEIPDRSHPVPTAKYTKDNRHLFRFDVEEDVRFVVLQITLVDGTTSPVYRYEPQAEQ